MNLFDLTGKIALVTGGAHSIGFAIGKALAQAGATVCFNCTSEGSRARGEENYAADGITAYGYVANVTSEEEMNALVARIREEHGIIDILVNNAGIIKRIPMLEMSVEDFRQVVDVDLNAPFICAEQALAGTNQGNLLYSPMPPEKMGVLQAKSASPQIGNNGRSPILNTDLKM